jgi:hypothetical protein
LRRCPADFFWLALQLILSQPVIEQRGLSQGRMSGFNESGDRSRKSEVKNDRARSVPYLSFGVYSKIAELLFKFCGKNLNKHPLLFRDAINNFAIKLSERESSLKD